MNRVKTVFLMTALAGILMAIGGLIGGRSGVMVMFLIATAMNFISYWFSDTMVCLLYTSPSPRDPKTSRMPSSA